MLVAVGNGTNLAPHHKNRSGKEIKNIGIFNLFILVLMILLNSFKIL